MRPMLLNEKGFRGGGCFCICIY